MNIAYEEIEVIKESLFEKCLYQHVVDKNKDEINYNDWFNYMISMRKDIDSHSKESIVGEDGKVMINTYEFKRTPQRILKELDYSQKDIKSIEKCVEDSF